MQRKKQKRVQLKELNKILRLIEDQNPEIEVFIRDEFRALKSSNGMSTRDGIFDIEDVKIFNGIKNGNERIKLLTICFEDQIQFKKVMNEN